MADFETWLKETKGQLNTLHRKFDDVTADMGNCMAELKKFRDNVEIVYANLKTNSSTSGFYFTANEDLRSSLSTLAFIGHDGETIINLPYFLERSGIDLNRVMPEDINYENIQVKQNGIAKLVDSSNSCSTVNTGYIGLVVPLKITASGQERSIELTTTILLNHHDFESKSLVIQLAHNTAYCPEGTFDLSTGMKILNYTQPVINSRLQNIEYSLGDISIGSRTMILYGASLHKNYLRIYTSFGLKGKQKMPLLAGPEPGFDILIKFGNEFLRDAIAAEISRLGLTISGGPYYNGSSSFSLDIQYTYRDSVKIGCVIIPYKIVVEAKVNVILSVSGRSTIVMKVDKLTDPEVVEITGDWIPGVSLITKIINLFLGRFEKALNFTRSYTVEQNQSSMKLELNAQFLILKLNM